MQNIAGHSLKLNNREVLEVTGVTAVDEFNDEEVRAVIDDEELLIKGELLHIDEFSVESGILCLSGKINSLTYSQKVSASSLLKRLFAS